MRLLALLCVVRVHSVPIQLTVKRVSDAALTDTSQTVSKDTRIHNVMHGWNLAAQNSWTDTTSTHVAQFVAAESTSTGCGFHVASAGMTTGGNFAHFDINFGNGFIRDAFSTARGVNIVVVDADYRVVERRAFDTHVAGNDAYLRTYLSSLSTSSGNTVLLAVMDEASSLQPATYSLLHQRLGSHVNQLCYRCSWALIARADGTLLAEQQMTSAATADVSYLSAPCTPSPPPVPSPPPSTGCGFHVASAGMTTGGNFAHFDINFGNGFIRDAFSTARGVNIVVVDADYHVVERRTFDTHVAGNDAHLSTYLSSLSTSSGNTVLLAVMDEASRLQPATYSLLHQRLGSHINLLCYRCSWALIARADGTLLAEQQMTSAATADVSYLSAPCAPSPPPPPAPPLPPPMYNAATITYYPYNNSCDGDPYGSELLVAGHCTRILVTHTTSESDTPSHLSWSQSLMVSAVTCKDDSFVISAHLFYNENCSGSPVAAIPSAQIPSIGTNRPGCVHRNSVQSFSISCTAH
ncbi:hypothetical protein AB1Y20_019976 [Prymnesium parvum]|uniref:ILEI/PANDER domain-containing protein n=1 Tax=Prymnesium parvum TaxID=97485 RepID=A0AB34JSB7_PRYPA